MSKVFIDTSYVIALSSKKDQYHKLAVTISERLQAERAMVVTTRAILVEIGDAMAKQSYRNAAIILLDELENDPGVEIISLSEEIYESAFNLYRNRRDKEWGLTDCISFVVMKEHGIDIALTTDEHFRQAGFRVPLIENVINN